MILHRLILSAPPAPLLMLLVTGTGLPGEDMQKQVVQRVETAVGPLYAEIDLTGRSARHTSESLAAHERNTYSPECEQVRPHPISVPKSKMLAFVG